MEPASPSQTAGSGSPASTPAATGTKSIEQLMAENEAIRREKDSLQASVQGLSRKNQEQEARLKEYETPAPPPSDTGAGEVWISREEAAALADARYKAMREQERQEQLEAQKAYTAFEGERAKWLKQAETEIPESMDHASAVYKKALELFADPASGLSSEGRPLYPNSEYLAYAKAKLVMATAAATAAETRAGTTFAAAGGGSSATTPQATGKLTPEEFLKLTPDQQAKYQEEQFQAKFR